MKAVHKTTIDEGWAEYKKTKQPSLPLGYSHLTREDCLTGKFSFPSYVEAIFFATDVMAVYNLKYRAKVVKGKGYGKTEVTFLDTHDTK